MSESVELDNGAFKGDRYHTFRGDGMTILSFQRNGEPCYLHPDHLGTVHLMTDRHGNKITTGLQTGYGNTLPLEKSGDQGAKENHPAKNLATLSFVGSLGIRSSNKTKLHYMRSRYYSSLLRRFISLDKERVGMNYFAYVNGKPIIENDPYGYGDSVPDPLFPKCLFTKSKTSKLDKEYVRERMAILYDLNVYYQTHNWPKKISIDSCMGMVKMTERMMLNLQVRLKCFRFAYLVDLFALLFEEIHITHHWWKKHFVERRNCIYEPFIRGYGLDFMGYGFAECYSDPVEERTADQVFHYMAYVIIAFKYGYATSVIASYQHEMPFGEQGHSVMDFLLGLKGAWLGRYMRERDEKATSFNEGNFKENFAEIISRMELLCDQKNIS